MWLCPGSQHGHERIGGIRVHSAFTRGQELPLTPAACHKGPELRREHGPASSLPPSLPQLGKSEQKRGLCLPSPEYQRQGRGGGSELSTVTSLPFPGPSQLRYVGSPSIWQGSFALGLQINSLVATIHGCTPLAFYVFESLYPELLRHFSF